MINPIVTFTLIAVVLTALPLTLFTLSALRRPYRHRALLIGGLAVLLMGGSFTLYLQLGSPKHLLMNLTTVEAATESLVERLEKRLRQQPDDPARWLLLGRSWLTLKQPEKAVHAFEQALRYAPDQPAARLLWAETLLLLNRRLDEVEAALTRMPPSPEQQWLLGRVYLKRGRPEAALAVWERLLAQSSPEAKYYESLRTLVRSIRERQSSNF